MAQQERHQRLFHSNQNELIIRHLEKIDQDHEKALKKAYAVVWILPLLYVNQWVHSNNKSKSSRIFGKAFYLSLFLFISCKAFSNADNAVSVQKPVLGLLLHTELGLQYTSENFSEIHKKQGIISSFSQKGCPYDNAYIESFHAILKKEEVHHVTYLDYESANLALFEYIEG